MKQQILNLLRKRWALPVATGVTGLGVGTTVGHVITRKSLDRQFDALVGAISQELETQDTINNELRVQIRQLETTVNEIKADKEVVLLTNLPTVDHRLPHEKTSVIDEHVLGAISEIENDRNSDMKVIRNVFDMPEDEWDYKTEIERRDRSRPYIIHVDEYVGDEMNFDQSTLTWYEGDSILCDSHDVPIYSPEAIVGELRFGHGSGDPNSVYIRNEQMQSEYEILRYTGAYQEIVLGERMEKEVEESELKHSFTRKFRSD